MSATFRTPALSCDEADNLCQEIIRRVETDDIDELKAREQIAELLEKTRIAWFAANEFNKSFPPQVREDLGTEMRALLYAKVMQRDGRGLEFDRAKGASLAGWARALLRSANYSLLRKVKAPFIVDPTDGHRTYIGEQPPAQPFRNTEVEAAGFEVAMEWFTARSRQLRDNSRAQAAYQSVMFSLDVPALVRPEYSERIRLRRLYDQDPALAFRSACAVRSLRDRMGATIEVDPGFLALWDDYSYNELDRVATSNDMLAQALVTGALADKPRPIRTTVRDFRVEARSYGEGRGWRAKVDELCEVYFALEYEAYSSFDARGVSKHEMLVTGQVLTRARADDIVALVLAHPGQRLGSERAEIFAKLDEIMSKHADRPVEPVDQPAAEAEDQDADSEAEPDVELTVEQILREAMESDDDL